MAQALGVRIEAGARVGNFVETKKTLVGEGSKINHLSYIGDTSIGADVNIGAGTIICRHTHRDRAGIADCFLHILDDFPQESRTILQAAPVFIRADIGQWRDEARQ